MLHQPGRWVISNVAFNETSRSDVVYLLTMSRHPILIRIDRDCMHRKLVGRAENADGNFLEKDGMECYMGGLKRRVHVIIVSYPAICDKDLCQGATMARRLAAHGLNRVHWRAWRTRGGGKDGGEPRGMKATTTRHGGGVMKSRREVTRFFIVGLGRQFYAFEKERLRQGG